MSLPPVEIPLGAIRFNSDSQKLEYFNGDVWMQVHTFSPNLNGGARGLFFGRAEPTITNRTDYITIPTAGNAIDFGDMNGDGYTYSTTASNVRGICAGGSPGHANVIDGFTFATQGNATDLGNLTSSRWLMGGGCSNQTRSIFTGGSTFGNPHPIVNTLDYITTASGGDAKDFGDQSVARRMQASANSSTRGLWAGGYNPSYINTIDYVTIATLGNAQDFGDQSRLCGEAAGVCNSTRGVFTGGGSAPGNRDIMDYVTIATTGNATRFGDLLAERRSHGACSSTIRGVVGGRYPNTNSMEYITIATTGTSADFGDLTATGHNVGATSNAHGGLG